jgi:hypothetical protein
MNRAGRVETPAAQVSVVIPTYNRARYLGQAIESALEQSGVSVEVIVVDDGSTDDTPRVVEPYLNRIRYVRQYNQGGAAARNHGIRLAEADNIAFQDSDDYFLPGALAVLHSALVERPDLGAVQGGLVLVDEAGEQLRVEEPWHEAPRLDLETCLYRKPIYFTAMMVRREWMERIGGFDEERWACDVDLLIRLVAAGCSIEWVPRQISCYWQHAGNMTWDAVTEAEDIEVTLDNYFARSDVPGRLRRQEHAVRFYSLVWSAWRMSCTGQTDEIVEWLRRSAEHSPYAADETLLAWLKLFVEHDGLADDAAAGSPVWLSAMRTAAESLALSWTKTEALFSWWFRVWVHYLEDDRAKAAEGLAYYLETPLCEVLSMAQDSLFLSPDEQQWVELVDCLWEDAKKLGLVPPSQRGAVTMLYLTIFGRATFGNEPALARRALGRALKSSRHRAALSAWLRFILNALVYTSKRGARVVFTISHPNEKPVGDKS